MFHLSCKLFGDEAYEITDRYTPPYTSSAQRHYDDSVSIRQLIMQFPPAPDDWVRILVRICERPLHFYSNHPGEVYDAVTSAVTAGELCIYKLPNLSEVFSLRGKDNTGLFFMRGPNPHCATHLKPEIIKSVQSAQQLLNESGISQALLLHELGLKSVYNSYQQHEPFEEVCRLLARGDILVYKIPLSPKAAPSTSTSTFTSVAPDEIVNTRPVSLGPHDEPGYVSLSLAAKPLETKSPTQTPPQSLDECEARLVAARERLIKEGYKPKYTDEQQLAKVQNNEVSKERFLVSFQAKNVNPDAKLAFQRDSGLVPVWATSFDQLENADSDPQLIASVLGTSCDPSKEYVLHIIDRGERLEQYGQNTFIPTWENMQEPTQKYLSEKHGSAVLFEVMTPEYQRQYAQDVEVYHRAGGNEFSEQNYNYYADSLGADKKRKFLARHNVRTELGANNEFTGNGLTQSREASTRYGVVEVLTLENNTSAVSAVANIKTVVLKPIRLG